MWLIDAKSLKLVEFQTCPTNSYAILSHTWGKAQDELSFDEFKAGDGRQKNGFRKIKECCEQAQYDGLGFVWIDTCCIDKRSSAELSEAINSMFSWYASAKKCYVYLADVERLDVEAALQSRWWNRGWTLQELIAPDEVEFYNRDWQFIGNKMQLASVIYTITDIEEDVLRSQRSFLDCSVAQRMSWAAKRQTTRIEDSAYCLLGLFNITMPLLYGEGANAFLRLQNEIIQHTDDESIFAWTGVAAVGSGLFATSAANFAEAAKISYGTVYSHRPPFAKSQRGLSIEVRLLPCSMNVYAAPLRCELRVNSLTSSQLVVFLCRTSKENEYRRVSFEGKCLDMSAKWDFSKAKTQAIFVPDDGRNLELAPHGGLPNICLDSNLRITQFLVHEQNDSRDALEANYVSKRRMAVTNAGDSKSTSTQQRLQLLKDPTNIQFQPSSRDMERGVVVALRRPESRSTQYDYYLQVGFDREFKPYCILGVQPFRVELPEKSSFWTLARDLLLSAFSINPMNIFMIDSMWQDNGPENGPKADINRLNHTRRKVGTFYRATWHCCANSERFGVSAFDGMPRITRLHIPFWKSFHVVPTTRVNMRDLIYATGEQSTHLEIHAHSHWREICGIRGYRRAKLTLTHSNNLQWILTFSEERATSVMWGYDTACPRCLYMWSWHRQGHVFHYAFIVILLLTLGGRLFHTVTNIATLVFRPRPSFSNLDEAFQFVIDMIQSQFITLALLYEIAQYVCRRFSLAQTVSSLFYIAGWLSLS